MQAAIIGGRLSMFPIPSYPQAMAGGYSLFLDACSLFYILEIRDLCGGEYIWLCEIDLTPKN
jgi:hypothetical protein